LINLQELIRYGSDEEGAETVITRPLRYVA